MDLFQMQQTAFQQQQHQEQVDLFNQQMLHTTALTGLECYGEDNGGYMTASAPEETMQDFQFEFEQRKRANEEAFEMKRRENEAWFESKRSQMIQNNLSVADCNSLDDVKAYFAR